MVDGKAYWNSASKSGMGNTLSDSPTIGRLAGQHAWPTTIECSNYLVAFCVWENASARAHTSVVISESIFCQALVY